uniref:Uncharacterized protein n=1 Tax=Nelumbo nucifera TaxID=4432 RepID=A0A822YRM7_NELNU|nr:TPA_asm: hypothetical protein HUJ06_004679 [Nelumbo nucifera]
MERVHVIRGRRLMAGKRNLRFATTAKEIQQKFVAVAAGGCFSPSPITYLTSVPSGRSLSFSSVLFFRSLRCLCSTTGSEVGTGGAAVAI